MGLFSKNTRDKDFDVEANTAAAEPPLVEATPIAYAAASLPTPAQAIATNKLNTAQQQQQQQTLPAYFGRHPTNMPPMPPLCGDQCPHAYIDLSQHRNVVIVFGDIIGLLASVLDPIGDGYGKEDGACLYEMS
eukprot:CAMPEP_0183743700 /NCGR_PEP_ID=MMETSP0737-20130205/65354_1 /TAXON_ID=385413 /ORGANISM="Thalassiosira miniscula, Strain CCMP1093" /LENGTH=132 /DNA_ID=CAMNT_0025979327 /DNA_START=557 /DNA_END=954 /DNA_ORIENTATION=-